jgi:hypothetical protein
MRRSLRDLGTMALCLMASSVSATTYYVDSADGLDAQDGLSPETAWASLEQATSCTPGSPSQRSRSSSAARAGVESVNGASATRSVRVTAANIAQLDSIALEAKFACAGGESKPPRNTLTTTQHASLGAVTAY